MPPSQQDHRNALPTGYQLAEFRILSILGHGGFGITYRARDEDLHQDVAIKEYLPREVATRVEDSTVAPISEADRETFEWGLDRFLEEARTLARFQHPNIIGVRRFLRANGTAYLVMDYCDGESLESLLAREGTIGSYRVVQILYPLLNALEELHSAGVTHRDIKPGNIYLKEDGSPLLLDFGAARQALAQHSRSVTAMATPGYAAFEQYSTQGKQGPWTDIYGLGATLYRCVAGQRPPDSSDRMLDDELIPAVRAAPGYPRALLEQIDTALKVKPRDRPQDIQEWRKVAGKKAPTAHSSAPSPSAQEKGPEEIVVPRSISFPIRDQEKTNAGVSWIVILTGIFSLFIVGFILISDPPAPGAGTSAPSQNLDRYRIPAGNTGIVRDVETGLEWMRCSLGKTWNGTTQRCTRTASEYTFDGAQAAASQLNNAGGYGGYTDWRVPRIEELRTLVYCSSGQPAYFKNSNSLCSGSYSYPTIVEAAFPDTPVSGFWSGSTSVGNSDYAWYVGFGFGNAGNGSRSGYYRVRLVREVDTQPIQSTLTFDSAGGSAVAAITGEAGAVVTAPANPTRTGYTFTGWSPAIPSTIPTQNQTFTAQWTYRYEILGANGEIVRDVETGLEWMRCALGQTWNSATQRCNRNAITHTFDGAQTAATQLNNTGGYGGYTNWRVPSIDELRTLVYCSSGQPEYFKNNSSWCEGSYSRPTIMHAAFPDTPSSSFWSGSPNAFNSFNAWLVAFGNGNAYDLSYRSNDGHVRLVRGGQ